MSQPSPDLPQAKGASFSRVMTVVRRGDKWVHQMIVNGVLSEREFNTQAEAVGSVDEERKKGPRDYVTTSPAGTSPAPLES